MAGSFDVILTTLQNGVSAINNLGNQIGDQDFFGSYITYTPTISSGSGTLTAANGTGRFKRVGSTVFISCRINIVTNGSAATDVIATLPVTAEGGIGSYIMPGREDVVTGKMLLALTSSGLVGIENYDGSYPGGDGRVLFFSGTYEAA